MKRITTILTLLMLVCMGVWAQITVGPSTGSYWKNGAVTSDARAPIWKSSVLAADGTNPLLVVTGTTGIDTSNGDIYANDNSYTLEAPTGYLISSYTINGTATGGDVTITPSGGSGTTISNGSSLGEPLSVTVRAQSTSFTLTGSGHITSMSFVVTVTPIPVNIARTASGKLPSAAGFGSFSGQVFTTSDGANLAGVTVTASTGLTIGEQHVDVSNYGYCFKLVTSAAATDYTVTMQAPTGYVITGYYLGCSANTKDAVHTLTSADGSVSVVASAPPYNNPTGPKVFEVTGLNTNSTYFTINTASKGNTLYLPIFQIYVAKASEVVSVTYDVRIDGVQKATKTVTGFVGAAPALPSSLERDFCTYEYYSDASCTTPISALTPSTTTVYAKCTFAPPFTVSAAFNTATWYYLKLNANYPTYVSEGTPNVTLPTSNASNSTTRWAFFGDPYTGLQLVNYAAGDGKVLGSESAASDGNTGANTYATVNTAGTKAYERWFPKSSTYYTNGFFLFNGEGYALNIRNIENLAYWTGGNDAGSTFIVEDGVTLYDLPDNYEIDEENLDKPGFPTTAAYTTFRTTIESFTLDQWFGDDLTTALTTLKASTVYPNGTYYIKNRSTGCYAFITDDGELVPRIKINNATPHNNNNYLWTVTSNKGEGTCSIVSSLYSDVPFAKGNNEYSTITAGNRTVITTLSTELFSSNNGTSGAFYLGGAHNNNVYNSAGNGNSHVVTWNYQNSPGSQWVFEPVDLGTEWTVIVEGLETGGQDAVVLSDGTIVNQGTGRAYLSETPTTENITQGAISGYSILDGSIVINSENHIITVTYSPSYDVLIDNYMTDNDVVAKMNMADAPGYPAAKSTEGVNLLATYLKILNNEKTEEVYNELVTNFSAFLAASPVIPDAGFYRIKSSAKQIASQPYLIGVNHGTQTSRAAFSTTPTDNKDIWYFDGTHLINYGNGGYPAVNNSSFLGVATVADATAATVEFEANGMSEFGALSIKLFGNARYLFTNTGLYTDAGSAKSANGYSFNVEKLIDLPVTISSALYATLYAPVALTIPSGVKAYTGTVSGNYLTLSEVSYVIPANTAVVLKADEADTYNFTFTTSDPFEGSNALRGTVSATTYTAGDLVLGLNNEGEIGFYALDQTTTKPLAGFKAYLPASVTTSRALKIVFDESETTGIHSVEEPTPDPSQMGREVIYDLQGRKVANPSRGLYIINGHKVVIK